MKNITNEQLEKITSTQSSSSQGVISYPSLKQLRDKQQVAHELRSLTLRLVMDKVLESVKKGWNTLKDHRDQRKTLLELGRLNDFMLKDIGLTRGDLAQLRYGTTTVSRLNHRRCAIVKSRQVNRKCSTLKFQEHIQQTERGSRLDEPEFAKCG